MMRIILMTVNTNDMQGEVDADQMIAQDLEENKAEAECESCSI